MDTPNIEPLAHSPESAARRLGTTTRAVYYLIASGELRSFKLGKRRLIPDAECERLVLRRMAEAERAAHPAPAPTPLSRPRSKGRSVGVAP